MRSVTEDATSEPRVLGHRLFKAERVLAVLAVLAAIYLLLPPILLTVFSAFRSPPDQFPLSAEAQWSFSNLSEVYANGAIVSTLLDTSIFVLCSVGLAFAISFTLAWLVERTDMPFRKAVFVLVILPLTIPGLLTTMGWLLLLSENTGMVNVVIRWLLPIWQTGPFDVFSFYGMVLVQGFSLVALMFIFLCAALRNIDATLDEASRISGASWFATFRKITLPVLRPSILGLMFLAAILTIESFEVPLLLGGGVTTNIFSTKLYYALNDASGAPPAYGIVGALGLHFLALTYLLFFLYHKLVGRGERFVTLGGQARRPKRQRLHGWKWVILLLVGIFLFVTSIGPLLILLWTSFLPQYVQPSVKAFELLSFDQYRDLLMDKRLPGAVWTTVIIASLAPTLSVGVALIIAWVGARTRRARGIFVALDMLLSSSIALPAIVAANAFLLFYLWMNQIVPAWFPLFGTVLVLVLVYSYRVAVAFRMTRSAVMQISEELEEAALVSGSTKLQTLRQITLPLLSPTVIGVWMLLFLVSVREFTLPLIIGRGSPPHVISVLTWKLWGLHTGQAAALGVLTVGFLIALSGLVWVGFRRRIHWDS